MTEPTEPMARDTLELIALSFLDDGMSYEQRDAMRRVLDSDAALRHLLVERDRRKQREGEGAEQPCTWVQDGFGEDHYDTSCGRRFSLDNGASPLENHMRFCCYCGRPLKESMSEETP